MLQFRLFILISILNAFDGLATAYGLHLNLVEEQNPLALYLWHTHPLLFITVKLLFSLILLYFPLFTAQEQWRTKKWTVILTSLTVIYLFVNIGSTSIFWTQKS